LGDPGSEPLLPSKIVADRTTIDDPEVLKTIESVRGLPLPRIGDVVAEKYVIERVLGSGGMGVVVEARHKALGELVAIKFLRADARARRDELLAFFADAASGGDGPGGIEEASGTWDRASMLPFGT